MTDNRTTEMCVKRLRELLDERGIEHYDHENGEPLRVLEKAEEPATSWRVDGASYCAVPDGKGTFDIWIDHCTPEQAIAETLGSGTCEYKPMWNDDDLLTGEYVGMWYTGCGDALVWNADNDGCCKPPAFCPYCGGAVKVVSA